MALLVVCFGTLIVVLGSVGVVRPDVLMAWVDRPWRSRAGLGLAALFRLLFGAVLLVAADDTRHPVAVTVLGVVSLAAAVLIPLLGYERLRRFVDWWMARPPAFIRIWGGIAIAFGGFLVYAAT